MSGYACGSGGVIFIPDEIDRKDEKSGKIEASKKKHTPVKVKLSNDDGSDDKESASDHSDA